MDAALALPAGAPPAGAPPAGASPLFAEAAPFATHRLAVGDGHVLHVEECGRAGGIAGVFLHGAPGRGGSPRRRRSGGPLVGRNRRARGVISHLGLGSRRLLGRDRRGFQCLPGRRGVRQRNYRGRVALSGRSCRRVGGDEVFCSVQVRSRWS